MFMSENLRVNIWRDKFTSDYLRVNLPSWNLSRIRAAYQIIIIIIIIKPLFKEGSTK